MDALSGDVKTLLSDRAALNRRKSAKEKSFAAPITFCSPAVSARGSASRAAPGLSESGSVLLEQAAARAIAAMALSRGKRRVDMIVGGWDSDRCTGRTRVARRRSPC